MRRRQIKNCSFLHLAATGVDLKKGVKDNMTKNNLFSDIGGTAILAGNYGDEGREIHLPFNPKDERERNAMLFLLKIILLPMLLMKIGELWVLAVVLLAEQVFVIMKLKTYHTVVSV